MRENLKNMRLSKNMTRKELAYELELSEIFVRKLESGASDPSNQTAVALAEYYKKPLDYLFPDIFLLSFDTKCIENKKEAM